MGIIFLLNSIFALIIFLLIGVHFVKEIKVGSLKRRDLGLVAIGIIYIIFSIMSFLWSNENFIFKKIDFLIIMSTVLVVQTVALITILYESTKNKKVFYSLIPYLFVVTIIYLDQNFTHLLIPTSLLIILFSFLILEDTHQKSIPALITYSSVSLIFYIIFTLNDSLLPILNLLPLIILAFFIKIFTEQLRDKPEFLLVNPRKFDSPIVELLRGLVFLIIITNFIFIGTVSIHELGHLGAAKISNCENIKIVYELNGFPHTEITCENTSSKNLWIMAGIILPIILAMFLALSGGIHIKEFSLQIIGFNLAISYLDIIALGFSRIIGIFASTIGISLIFISLILLAKSRSNPLINLENFNHIL